MENETESRRDGRGSHADTSSLALFLKGTAFRPSVEYPQNHAALAAAGPRFDLIRVSLIEGTTIEPRLAGRRQDSPALQCEERTAKSEERWPYNLLMDDQSFRRRADESLDDLKRSLYAAEGDADLKSRRTRAHCTSASTNRPEDLSSRPTPQSARSGSQRYPPVSNSTGQRKRTTSSFPRPERL